MWSLSHWTPGKPLGGWVCRGSPHLPLSSISAHLPRKDLFSHQLTSSSGRLLVSDLICPTTHCFIPAGFSWGLYLSHDRSWYFSCPGENQTNKQAAKDQNLVSFLAPSLISPHHSQSITRCWKLCSGSIARVQLPITPSAIPPWPKPPYTVTPSWFTSLAAQTTKAFPCDPE